MPPPIRSLLTMALRQRDNGAKRIALRQKRNQHQARKSVTTQRGTEAQISGTQDMMDAEHMMEQRAIYASLQQRNNKRRRSEYGEDRVHRQRNEDSNNVIRQLQRQLEQIHKRTNSPDSEYGTRKPARAAYLKTGDPGRGRKPDAHGADLHNNEHRRSTRRNLTDENATHAFARGERSKNSAHPLTRISNEERPAPHNETTGQHRANKRGHAANEKTNPTGGTFLCCGDSQGRTTWGIYGMAGSRTNPTDHTQTVRHVHRTYLMKNHAAARELPTWKPSEIQQSGDIAVNKVVASAECGICTSPHVAHRRGTRHALPHAGRQSKSDNETRMHGGGTRGQSVIRTTDDNQNTVSMQTKPQMANKASGRREDRRADTMPIDDDICLDNDLHALMDEIDKITMAQDAHEQDVRDAPRPMQLGDADGTSL